MKKIVNHLEYTNLEKLETANIELTEEICNFILRNLKKLSKKPELFWHHPHMLKIVRLRKSIKVEKLVINLNDKLEQVADLQISWGFW